MLSADGRVLYKDFQELIQTTREVIAEKNQEELFQNFIYHCTQASDTAPSSVNARGTVGHSKKLATETIENEGKEVLENMKSVAKLVTTNSEFRSILNDLFQLAVEVFGDGADKAAREAQRMAGRASEKANNLSQATVSATQEGNSSIQRKIQKVADKVQAVARSSKDNPVDTAHGTRDDILEGTSSAMDAVRQQTGEMREQASMQTEDAKNRAQVKKSEIQEDAFHYANQKMPPEQRRVLIERLKLTIGQIQSNPQYQATIDSLMGLVGTWRKRAREPAGDVSTGAVKVIHDPNVDAATTEFKTILERWAQGYSLDPMIELVQYLWKRAARDPLLSGYLDTVSTFMNRALREPNYMTSQAINREADDLIDQGHTLFRVKYKADTDALLNEGQNFAEKLGSDPMVRQVAECFQRVASTLFYDKEGKLVFKQNLFDDFRYVLMPSLLETFQFIPIPRIEYSDLKVDLMFDNMILTSTDLVPRLIEVHMNNSMRMVPRGNAKRSLDSNKHEFTMAIQGLEVNVRDVHYYVKTKEGFRFKDRGIADVLIHKRGLDIHIEGQKTPEDDQNPSLITFNEVKVKIHSLSIKLRRTQHSVLNIFAQPFIKTAVKNAIAHALETEIKEALISGDRTLATTLRDTRIKTGKNTFGALMETATSFVQNKISPEDDTKSGGRRRKSSGKHNRTSRVIFDQDGLCVLDPVKHIELKVGQPLHEDKNAMENMSITAPWASPVFDMQDLGIKERNVLPGMRRTQGTMAM
ncbi:hypothetical protein BGX27_000656 [Mortierella sp. AM989]|nr:hypothetical protein BGX27_000656 [Mortierella sp. AM989]